MFLQRHCCRLEVTSDDGRVLSVMEPGPQFETRPISRQLLLESLAALVPTEFIRLGCNATVFLDEATGALQDRNLNTEHGTVITAIANVAAALFQAQAYSL